MADLREMWAQLNRERDLFKLLVDEVIAGQAKLDRLALRASAVRMERAVVQMAELVSGYADAQS